MQRARQFAHICSDSTATIRIALRALSEWQRLAMASSVDPPPAGAVVLTFCPRMHDLPARGGDDGQRYLLHASFGVRAESAISGSGIIIWLSCMAWPPSGHATRARRGTAPLHGEFRTAASPGQPQSQPAFCCAAQHARLWA